ncbi:MAG: hypothetical protein B6I36_02020 [Desulfobacteraceae bacterium 4572_35.1]|nr:MAG: hypothetical protein B6I36_02020 [Desulfobacteraceae bacterium 4572_35.1]
MQIKVSDLKNSGFDLKLERSAASFPMLAELQRLGRCVFLTPISVVVHANLVGGMVELDGHISVDIEVPCSRCLAPCRRVFSSDFRQTYVDQLPEVTGEDGEELELSAEEMGLELINDDEIDLNEEIQQQVALLVPEHSLCSELCKGLCAECGADLNKEKCSCADNVGNLNFAALKDFKVEK